MNLWNELLLSVVEVSLSSGAIILILFLTEPFFIKRYTAKWRYYTWIALAVRMIIPVNPDLPVSRMEISIPTALAAPAADIAGEGIPVILQTEAQVRRAAGFSALDILAAVWLTVFGCIVMVHICSYFHSRRKILKNGTCVEEESVLRQLRALKRELGICKRIDAIRYRDTAGPMIIGFFRPLLVMPEGAYTEEELFFILKHELIHVKRHDTLFKFLFMAARALHWFNPAALLMQRAAVSDMEFSCDEQVVQGNSYTERKRYMETLFSTLEKQVKKTNLLTTQFYGGSRIMKRRFQNILRQSDGKRGFFLLPLAICMTLVLGMLTGCAAAQTEALKDTETQTDREQAVEEQDALSQEPADTVLPEEKPDADTAEEAEEMSAQDQEQSGLAGETEQTDTQAPGGRVPLSEDAVEISNVSNAFALAYFAGEKEEMRKYLADSYEGDLDVYSDADTELVGMMALNGVEDIADAQIGDMHTVSLVCDMAGTGEGLWYLTLEVMKQEEGWKILSYGMEK